MTQNQIPKAISRRIELALSLSQKGEREKAIEVVKQGIKLFPQDVSLKNLWGILLTEEERWDDAEKIFKSILNDFPRSFEVYSNLGVLEEKRKNFCQAKEYYQKALQINPEHETAQKNLAVLNALHFIPKKSISLCMIVKNEEEFLPGCLESVKNAVDEIIIVDTGSTDKTVEIAKSFGAKVFFHPWENDFSKARNYSLSYATCDWIMCMDADEELFQEDIPKLRFLTNESICNGISFLVYNEMKGGREGFLYSPRIWRNHIGAHYEGIVHNQLVLEGTILQSDARILHHGYALNEEKMSKKSERSKDLLKIQIKENPHHAFAHFNYAQICRGQGLWDEVIEHAQKVIEILSPENKSKLHVYLMALDQLACAYLEKGELEKAKNYCQKALQIKPDYLDPLLILGHLYNRKGEKENAQKWYEKYLNVQKNYDEKKESLNLILNNLKSSFVANYEIGLIELERGNIAGSREKFEEVLRENPHYLDVNLHLGKLHFEEKDYSQARIYFQKEIENNPNSFLAYNFLGDCYFKSEEFFSALESYEKAYEKNQNYLDALFNSAITARKLNDLKKTLDYLSQLLEKAPTYLDAIKERGNLFYEMEEFENALSDYASYLKSNPEQLEVLNNLANTHFRLQNYSAAEECYQEITQKDNTFILAFRNLAALYKKTGNVEKAIQNLEKCQKLAPKDYELKLLLGDLLLEKRDFEKALENYENYLSHFPSEYGVLFKIADCYFNLGYLDAASMGYQAVLKINPNFTSAQDELEKIRKLGQVLKS